MVASQEARDRHRAGPIRIANVSGFYGDRIGAPREMLEGPDRVDVLTGDYLAELTMLIMWKARQRDPAAGYATTFLTQMQEVMGRCLERGVKVVTNAGGLNPRGLAAKLSDVAGTLGLNPKIAFIEGDDLLPALPALQAQGHELRNIDTDQSLAAAGRAPVTANAYLGGWGIAAALDAGADIVVCPRVTDAALVVGPAAWWHGWARDDWDRLAGAIVAGHVIECGPQCTGGNYCFASEITRKEYPGFPIAEVAADGSCVVTKQPDTGGAVTVGTVTAQLLYEIAGPAYANPDAVARFDTVHVEQVGPDRVRISGARGEPAPDVTKVALNFDAGYRNTMSMVITGLDVEAKADRAESMLFELLGGREQFGAVDVQLLRHAQPFPATNAEATCQLRVTVKDPDQVKVGRRFSNAVVELSLASYAGFFTTTPPTGASAYGVYWPALVPTSCVPHRVVMPDGSETVVGPVASTRPVTHIPPAVVTSYRAREDEETLHVPLGVLCGARSGDKGGNANVGIWVADDASYSWLVAYLDGERLHSLLPETAGLPVQRHLLPNLRAINFVVEGLLGEGVASSVRVDPQAKGLAEFLRSRLVDMPASLAGPRQQSG